MKVIESVHEMMSISDRERARGKSIRLVPTMGALHRGHASLIEAASEIEAIQNVAPRNLNYIETYDAMQLSREDVIVIVSIFVNPLQFNNSEDFSNYPKTMQADLDICKRLDVDYVFVPALRQIYPDNSRVDQCVVCPEERLANTLEGESRPGHFKGMLTVVCKLFNITKPHDAYFGEKDYQQLLLVTKMSQDLSMGIKIVPVTTVRDEDMLPLSSRNVRLTLQQRQIAPVIYRILIDAKQTIECYYKEHATNSNYNLDTILAASMVVTLSFAQVNNEIESVEVDYLQLRCSNDLSELKYNQERGGFDCIEGCMMHRVTGETAQTLKARLLASVIIGNVRLLDNIEVLLDT